MYVPKKGASKLKGVNQMQSSMSSIIKEEDNKGKPVADEFGGFSKRVDYRDRAGQDVLTWSNSRGDDTQSEFGGKKKSYNHKAAQDNGNFLQWGK